MTPQNDKSLNLLSVARAGVKITPSGDRIIFSSGEIVGLTIEVTLEGPKGAVVTTQMVVTSCRLRRSLFFGQSETGADVSGVNMIGRLSGCKFEGDWWVRTVPMFGGHERVFAVDGYVQSDGNFWLVLEGDGVRHLLIIGKGKKPIKSIGFDVTAGKKINAGVIDLSSHCANQ